MLDYSGETVRGIILGDIKYRRCPMCEGQGYQNWDENGTDIRCGRATELDRSNGECENCDGLGFILETH